MKGYLWIVLVLGGGLLSLVLAMRTCIAPLWVDRVSPPSSQFDVQVSLSPSLPRLYQPFTATLTATASQPQKDMELWIEASGAVYLSGEMEWHGRMKDKKTISATLAFVREGEGMVAGRFRPSQGSWGKLASAGPTETRLIVGRGGSQPGSNPFFPTPPPGSSPLLRAEPPVVADTTRLLNQSSLPRFEVVQGIEDVRYLQRQALFPTPLRYGWAWLEGIDFGRYFLVAFWGSPNPVLGYRVELDYGSLFVEGSKLRGNYTIYTVPPEVPRPPRKVSPVEIRQVKREMLSYHLKSGVYALSTPTTFEVSVNGRALPSQVVELAGVPPPFPTPPPYTPRPYTPPPPTPRPPGTVDILLLPDFQQIPVGSTFSLTLQVEAGEQILDGIDAIVGFDPKYLEAVEVQPGSALPVPLARGIDNSKGRVVYSAGRSLPAFPGEQTGPKGTFTLATLRFRAKAPTRETALSLVHQPPFETEVVYKGYSVLRGVKGATVVIGP